MFEYESADELYDCIGNPDKWSPCFMKSYQSWGYYAPKGSIIIINDGKRIIQNKKTDSILVLENECCNYSVDTVIDRFDCDIDLSDTDKLELGQKFVLTRKISDSPEYMCFFVPVKWKLKLSVGEVNADSKHIDHWQGDFLVLDKETFDSCKGFDKMKIYTAHHFAYCFNSPDAKIQFMTPYGNLYYDVRVRLKL